MPPLFIEISINVAHNNVNVNLFSSPGDNCLTAMLICGRNIRYAEPFDRPASHGKAGKMDRGLSPAIQAFRPGHPGVGEQGFFAQAVISYTLNLLIVHTLFDKQYTHHVPSCPN